jgi:hypothetical protein
VGGAAHSLMALQAYTPVAAAGPSHHTMVSNLTASNAQPLLYNLWLDPPSC